MGKDEGSQEKPAWSGDGASCPLSREGRSAHLPHMRVVSRWEARLQDMGSFYGVSEVLLL